jgi:hypothetical protein
MKIVSYDKYGYPIELARVVSIDDLGVLKFQVTDDQLAHIISSLHHEAYDLVLTPIPAVPKELLENVPEMWARLHKENEVNLANQMDEVGRQEQQQILSEGYIDKARRLVFEYIDLRFDKSDPEVKFTIGDVYVVWFCKTLQNWKALVSTELPDLMYYEVTYNGDKKETYLDAYKKFDNVCIPDLPRRVRDMNLNPAGRDRFA